MGLVPHEAALESQISCAWPGSAVTSCDSSAIQLVKKTLDHQGCNNIDISFSVEKNVNTHTSFFNDLFTARCGLKARAERRFNVLVFLRNTKCFSFKFLNKFVFFMHGCGVTIETS
jgi:hypothetical protein